MLLFLPLNACAVIAEPPQYSDVPFEAGGYFWIFDPKQHRCKEEEVIWIHVPNLPETSYCNFQPLTIGCTKPSICTIYSKYSKEEAQKYYQYYWQSHYEHEMWHATKQLKHPE